MAINMATGAAVNQAGNYLRPLVCGDLTPEEAMLQTTIATHVACHYGMKVVEEGVTKMLVGALTEDPVTLVEGTVNVVQSLGFNKGLELMTEEGLNMNQLWWDAYWMEQGRVVETSHVTEEQRSQYEKMQNMADAKKAWNAAKEEYLKTEEGQRRLRSAKKSSRLSSLSGWEGNDMNPFDPKWDKKQKPWWSPREPMTAAKEKAARARARKEVREAMESAMEAATKEYVEKKKQQPTGDWLLTLQDVVRNDFDLSDLPSSSQPTDQTTSEKAEEAWKKRMTAVAEEETAAVAE